MSAMALIVSPVKPSVGFISVLGGAVGLLVAIVFFLSIFN
jgi:hypothetical protein